MSDNLKVQLELLKIDEINKLHFNSFIEPQVSIIIPVFNNWKYTYCCLNSILEHTEEVTYEVIVVDDGSSDETVEMLEKVQNIRIILNESNLGYLKACNRGAEVAKGQYLLFLNNDTEPQEGWLENLLSIADGDKVIGAVGAKLIYPDGKLQEAGGMIFSDGRPWKFGNGDDPEKEIYNQICEVDYCSGACLLVRKNLFTELGGFDVRYVPAYYEDADLCFTLRKMGYKVLYSPEVVVIHYEAVTAGKNAYSWGEINRMKFIEKWENELTYQDEHPSITGEFPATANRERLTKIPTFENKLKFLKNIYKLLNALTEERDTWIRAHSVSEADRAARLEVIERQAKEFGEKIAELEADRAARLEIIERQAKEFSEKAAEFEADQAARLELINSLSERLQASEADRAARLEIIERQAKEFSEKTAELKSSMSWKITAPFRRILDKWNTIKERFSSKPR
jgi:GT2 family glycosyltransferase